MKVTARVADRATKMVQTTEAMAGDGGPEEGGQAAGDIPAVEAEAVMASRAKATTSAKKCTSSARRRAR